MQDKPQENHDAGLPPCAAAFIQRVVRRMWYRRRARAEVRAELTAHFEDVVRQCPTAEEKERKARELIEGFGDARLLAALCHRAKKRCRPLWQKVLLRGAQGVGIVFLYAVLCMLPPSLGRPTIRVNYAAWLSDHWRPPMQGIENAKVHFDGAAARYVAPPPELEPKVWTRGWAVSDYNDSNDVRALETWLARNEAAFTALRRGAATPHYWPTYAAEPSAPIEMSLVAEEMETLKQWRHVTLVFRQQVLRELRQGQVAKALDDCLILQRIGRHLQGKGSLHGQLVGMSIEALSYSGLTTILRSAAVPAAALARVQQELVSRFDLHRQVVDLACEKAFWLDRIQRTFTDDGQGGGHALSQGFVYAPGDWKGNLANALRFRYPDRRETVAMVERFFPQVQGRLNVFPGVGSPAAPDDPVRAPPLNFILSLATRAYDGVAQQGWRLKTQESAVITLLAIQRYFRTNGRYPESLDQLLEGGFLPQLPPDPFGQGMLTYRKTDTGFLLYSWGNNRQDDGGQMGVGYQGQMRMWADTGDWVFWPASEP